MRDVLGESELISLPQENGLGNPTRRQVLGWMGAGMAAAALSGCSGSNSSATSTSYEKTIQWARQAIQQQMRENPSTVAVSAALSKNGKIVWQEAFGMASVPKKVAVTTETRFNIGSVSKVIPALAAVILVDQGLLDLDAPIVKYLPNFKTLSPESALITSRQLVSHSSGLAGTNNHDIFMFSPVANYADDTQAGLANCHLKHLPGELAVYCNDGFTMFEQVVLAVSGKTFADFVQANILTPLGMTHSSYITSPLADGTFVYPYSSGTQYRAEVPNAYAAGGLSSTPGDMMNLAEMFLGGGMFRGKRIVSADGISKMATNQAANLPINPSPEWDWGLGWDSVAQPGLKAMGIKAWEKNGGTVFFASEFFVLPDANMALFLSGNIGLSDGYKALPLAEGILVQALTEDGTLPNAPTPIATTVPAVATTSNASGFAGIYGNSRAPIKVTIDSSNNLTLQSWDGDNSVWTALDTGSTQYKYRTDGWWWSDTSAGPSYPSYRFQTVSGIDAEGKAYSYTYLMKRYTSGAGYDQRTLPIGQLLKPLTPLSAAWQARMGTKWLVSNGNPDDIGFIFGNLPGTVSSLPELPGYILLGGGNLLYQLLVPLSDDRGGMAVTIPVDAGRDLYEIQFTTQGGKDVMLLASFVFEKA